MTKRSLLWGLALIGGLAWPALTQAADSVYTGLFSSLAVGGYDSVAYFEDKKPVRGTKEHTFEWRGATWRFASAEHRARFRADPERYAPQYGGYCAYAMADGETVSSNPEAWRVVSGKLYLNYSKKVRAKWERDIAGYVTKADRAWSQIRDGT